MMNCFLNFFSILIDKIMDNNFATWLESTGTFGMGVAAFLALNTWKKELKFKHFAAFVAQVRLLLSCFDDFLGTGEISDKIKNLTKIERPYWNQLYQNEVKKFNEEQKCIYKDLMYQKAYIESLKVKFNYEKINELINKINKYKTILNAMATAKLNFCHEDDSLRQVVFNDYQQKYQEALSIKSNIHKQLENI